MKYDPGNVEAALFATLVAFLFLMIWIFGLPAALTLGG